MSAFPKKPPGQWRMTTSDLDKTDNRHRKLRVTNIWSVSAFEKRSTNLFDEELSGDSDMTALFAVMSFLCMNH
jgi:hypothetical protein